MLENLDLDRIQDEYAREVIRQALNLIETQAALIQELRAENQRLRDENNRLKGEQGKPNVKGNTRKPQTENHSSEQERRQKRTRQKKAKNATIQIDREQILCLNRKALPKDAESKGYEAVVIQDIVFKTDNVRFLKAKYYSATEHQTYVAPLPPGYQGEFGPGIREAIWICYYSLGSSEKKIQEFLRHYGIQISSGQISHVLTQGLEAFHAEKQAVFDAGLASTAYQNIDDTLTRVDGQNQNCHVVGNEFYTIYQTEPTKERLTLVNVLLNGRERRFRMDEWALQLIEANLKLPPATRQVLQSWRSEESWSETDFLKRLDTDLPHLNPHHRPWILTAPAISYYRSQPEVPVVRTLVCDDAPQFKALTETLSLCWVHEGRPYKKLAPVIPQHRDILQNFRTQFWEYYHQLLAYRQKPTLEGQVQLAADFDTLFSTHTGYEQLDNRIAKTLSKKAQLLLVLEYPELPLHNNLAELAVRQRVRKRDVSFGPRTQDGKRAWDTFMSLVETTKKLGVSFYAYLHDRLLGTQAIPPLAELILIAAQSLSAGGSSATA